VVEAEAFTEIRNYIRANPLKRFLGPDYLYSSANPEFELDRPPQRLKALGV